MKNLAWWMLVGWWALAQLVAVPACAQAQKLGWEALTKVDWEKKYNQQYKQEFAYPKFAASVKGWEGKEIVIKGYLLPVDVGGQYLVISRFPFESCFFCGGAGPESVMQVYMKNPFKIRRKMVTFKGKLRLNDRNVDDLIYILDGAEMVPDEG
jgi:hypothetical protein